MLEIRMSITNINNFQDQILQNIKTLPPEKQQKVLEFAKSLHDNSLFQKWDNISDAEAQALQNEFSQEDIAGFARKRYKRKEKSYQSYCQEK